MIEKKNKAAEYKWVQRKSAAAQALWNTKKGKTGIDTMTEGEIRDIDSVEDGFRLVEEAHDASHFAKTGKNPESSRGHTVYVLLIQMTNPQGADFNNLKTEFVVVDLAGSEGGNTLEALPDGPEKTCRFLEGGVINYGLTSLKDMFGEMRKKGKLKKTQGVGLRKLLYPFMTTNTMMSIVFTLSPSWDNVMPTRATMKFAQDACKLKMKPVAASGGKNFQKLYEKLKETLNEKLELIDKLQSTIDQGIEHMETSGGNAGGGHMAEVLGTIYQEKQDKVYQMYKDYGLTDYLDHAVLEDVESSMHDKKEEYFSMIKAVLKKKDPERVDEIYDMLDEYMAKGIGYHAGYEFICEQYGAKAKKDKYAERESRGISMAQSQGGDTSAWAENAKLLQSQAGSQVEAAQKSIEDLENEILNQDDGGDAAESYAVMEVADDVHDDIEFEEIDVSGPPDFYQKFNQGQQDELSALFADPKNVENGKMKYKFIKYVMNTYELSKAEVTDLHQFMLIKQGQNNVLSAVKDFSAEMGGDDAMLDNMENMDVLLDLKQQIHQLENEKRVEKSLKLWGQMRLKIRDRKLKTREMQVAALESKLSAKTDELDNVNTGMMADIKNKLDGFQGGSGGGAVDQKLDMILTAAGAGGFGAAAAGPDEKIEAELHQVQQQCMVYEEQIESMKAMLNNVENDQMQALVGDMGALQSKLSQVKLDNVRCEGQMLAIRQHLSVQSRTIDNLTAQIFIILQFPKMITVSGREGFNDKMNGDYLIGSHLHSGRVFYKHQDNSWVIRWYAPKGLWIMDHRGLNDDDMGSACTDADVGHPMMVRKQWIVFGGDNEGFRVDPNVMISGDMNVAGGKRGPGM